MNKKYIAIRVENSDQWTKATNYLKQSHNCKNYSLDDYFPKYVFYNEMCNVINGHFHVNYVNDNYIVKIFQDIQELNPYWKFETAFKNGKIIEFLGSDNKWYGLNPKTDSIDNIRNKCIDKLRIKVPYQHFLDAINEGKTIQYRWNEGFNSNIWQDIKNPQFGDNFEFQINNYRIKPEDPYKIFKDAILNGKNVQYSRDKINWINYPNERYVWNLSPEHYRIKQEPPMVEYSIGFKFYGTSEDYNALDKYLKTLKINQINIGVRNIGQGF